MNTTEGSEVKVKLEDKKSKIGKRPIPVSDKARENVEKQRSVYMKRKGKNIRFDDLAGKLLETATL